MITPPEYKPMPNLFPKELVRLMVQNHRQRWGMYFYIKNNVNGWIGLLADPFGMEKVLFPEGCKYPEIKCTLQEYLEFGL